MDTVFTCPICLEDEESDSRVALVQLPCNHRLHVDCFNQLESTGHTPRCPLCREEYSVKGSDEMAPTSVLSRLRSEFLRQEILMGRWVLDNLTLPVLFSHMLCKLTCKLTMVMTYYLVIFVRFVLMDVVPLLGIALLGLINAIFVMVTFIVSDCRIVIHCEHRD